MIHFPTGLAPLLFATLLATAAPAAFAQATLHLIGDLPGGPTISEVRDATKVGDVLYAVGSGTAIEGSDTLDTAVLWTSTGGLVPLPNLVANAAPFGAVIASAITPDAAFIASRARAHEETSLRHAVRVTTAGLGLTTLGNLGDFTETSAANTISADGSVLYGFGSNSLFNTQAVRYTIAGPTAFSIPFLPGHDTSLPAGRGASADGAVMVGTSGAAGVCFLSGPGCVAFRYVHGSGVSAIPFAPGGSWSHALAVSPNGNLTMAAGDSTDFPNGENYIHDAGSGSLARLGSPAAGWSINNFGGMTADGSVVVSTYFSPFGSMRETFVRNANGWFTLREVAQAAGISLAGWTGVHGFGISPDGTLVFGDVSDGIQGQGMVMEFPAGYLAAYDGPVVTNSIVGTWRIASASGPEHDSIIAFLPNGFAYHVQHPQAEDEPGGSDGYERVAYTWEPLTNAFSVTVLTDTNGGVGFSVLEGIPGMTIARRGDFLDISTPAGPVSAARVAGSLPLVGGWVIGDAAVTNNATFVAFLPDGTYFLAADFAPGHPVCPSGGIEYGEYDWDEGTGALSVGAFVDTNGACGLSHPFVGYEITVAGNEFTFTDGATNGTGVRVEVAGLARARSDFSGDGKSDLLFANADGRAAIWRMEGTTPATTAEIIGAGTGWSVAQVADFDDDGKSDLVWQHTDGRMAIYLMDGTVPASTQQLLNAGDWSVVHTPDLDGDGKADLLFRNTDGSVAVWTMDGTFVTAGASIMGPGTGWSVIATGDFDGDFNDDLLWRHTDGRHAIWLMDGAALGTSTQILNAGDWTATHAPDLNGDGKADIVWQHADGTVALWLMDGAAMATGAELLGAGTGWSVSRTGDFDDDGSHDLLFQHTDGRAAIYLMFGLTPHSTQQILDAGGGWSATRLQDLNGDGADDIVWQNADGSSAVWLMSGTAVLQGAQLIGTGTGWSVSAVSP